MFDYHTHTSFSDDSSARMDHMIEAAYFLGFREIAVTDHYDPKYPNRDLPFDLDFKSYHCQLDEMRSLYSNRIKVIKGIEIGLQKKAIEECRAAASAYDYDFIIASFHCAQNKELYGGDFFKNKTVDQAYIDFYKYVRDCLTEYKDYSVLGHINIIDRYAGSIPQDHVYMDIVEEILKIIISDGKGIEINTSSFRYGMGDRMTPALSILRLYKSLGGEIVTIGSDAHFPEDVGYKLDFLPEFLKAQGFRHITTFEGLRAIQNPI